MMADEAGTGCAGDVLVGILPEIGLLAVDAVWSWWQNTYRRKVQKKVGIAESNLAWEIASVGIENGWS
jgi:hypothetical protein